jgi:hypothetical protein
MGLERPHIRLGYVVNAPLQLRTGHCAIAAIRLDHVFTAQASLSRGGSEQNRGEGGEDSHRALRRDSTQSATRYSDGIREPTLARAAAR